MALDELAATIETIKQRIIDHRSSLAANETRTRQVLIDPLLAALGWDVSDPDQVELEYDVRGRRADYALLGAAIPVAVIEAKRLGHQLVDDNTMQVMNYANTAGIEYMVVTNGDEWKMYSVFERGAIEERVIMELKIGGETSYVNALKSLSLWRANVGSESQPVAANEPFVATLHADGNNVNYKPSRSSMDDQYGADLAEPQSPSSGGELEPTMTSSGDERPLDYVSGLKRGSPLPNRITFPDNRVVQLGSGVDVLKAVANWLAANGRLDHTNARVDWIKGASRFLANERPIHPSGKSFWKPYVVEHAGIYLEIDLTIQEAVDSAVALSNHCGINPRTISLSFD